MTYSPLLQPKLAPSLMISIFTVDEFLVPYMKIKTFFLIELNASYSSIEGNNLLIHNL